MTSNVHYLRPFRLVGNGTSFEPPCRDVADLPAELRERVLAARGIAREPDRDPPPAAA